MVFPNPNDEYPRGYYPMSNACGQNGASYTDSPPNTCLSGRNGDNANNAGAKYECDVDPTLTITASDESNRAGDHPPALACFPRTNNATVTGHYDPVLDNDNQPGKMVSEADDVVPSYAGRTDVEGCCYWGRGALHTRGTCNLGKLNHFLGAGGAGDNRDVRYPEIDFCRNPGAVCTDDRTMELRWTVALFEWAERVQSFDDGRGWNYIDEVTKFTADKEMISSVEFSLMQGEPSHFVDEVGGVLEQGCPYPPCDRRNPKRLRWRHRRKRNFVTALEGVGLPVKSDMYRRLEDHLLSPTLRANFENVLLQSKSPMDGKMYQSYRYHFEDFIESLRKMADVGFLGDDGATKYFYIGQGVDDPAWGRTTGLMNLALFLAYAIDMSILDDACDEHNTQLVNGRHPVSNSCGMYGESYQDLVCTEEERGKECPLDINQSFSAVTRALNHR